MKILLTREELFKLLTETIDHFQERQFRYKENNEDAKYNAMSDTIQGLCAMGDLEEEGEWHSASMTFHPNKLEEVAYRLALAAGNVPACFYGDNGLPDPIINEVGVSEHLAKLAIVKYAGYSREEVMDAVFGYSKGAGRPYEPDIKSMAFGLAMDCDYVPSMEEFEKIYFLEDKDTFVNTCRAAVRKYEGKSSFDLAAKFLRYE